MNNASLNQIAVNSQRSEITEYHIYSRLAELEKDPGNREVLRRIGQDELSHYNLWKKYSGADVAPDLFRIAKYVLVARVLGLTFAIKMLERGEQMAQDIYAGLPEEIAAGMSTLAGDEERHEHELIALINEDRLKYVGVVVLGLNDALVELTGALSGFAFALRDTKLVLMAGLVTGIAGSLSMAASQYLSTRAEPGEKHPMKAAVYTGVTYVGAVLMLVLPFMLFGNVFAALAASVVNVVLIILFFTFYVSVAQGIPFKKRFAEMTLISLGVAAVTFLISIAVRRFLGLEV